MARDSIAFRRGFTWFGWIMKQICTMVRRARHSRNIICIQNISSIIVCIVSWRREGIFGMNLEPVILPHVLSCRNNLGSSTRRSLYVPEQPTQEAWSSSCLWGLCRWGNMLRGWLTDKILVDEFSLFVMVLLAIHPELLLSRALWPTS